MYINDLGIARTGLTRTDNTVSGKKNDSYAAVMKKAADRQKTTVNDTYTSAEDIIIKEAIEKMKTDPEWETSVMNKVKEYYANDYRAGDLQANYLNWTARNGLFGVQSGLGMGLTGYSPYGFDSLAASAYSSMMNGAFGGSLLGSWQL